MYTNSDTLLPYLFGGHEIVLQIIMSTKWLIFCNKCLPNLV